MAHRRAYVAASSTVEPGRRSRPAISLPQHPNQQRSERPILLAVNQQFGEGATLRVAAVGLDRADALEIRERKDVEKPLQLLATYHLPFAASLTTAFATSSTGTSPEVMRCMSSCAAQ